MSKYQVLHLLSLRFLESSFCFVLLGYINGVKIIDDTAFPRKENMAG